MESEKELQAHTVQAYVNALLKAYFFYDIKRFDVKGRESYVLLESITSLISDLETICLDSETVIADMQ